MKPLFISLLIWLVQYSFAAPKSNHVTFIDSLPICFKSNKIVKINANLFRNKPQELVDFVIDKTEYRFISFIHLNKDDKTDIVAYTPSATGTSNEQLYTFFINCDDNNYIPVLSEYGREYYIKKEHTNTLHYHDVVLESWIPMSDSTGIWADKSFRIYAYNNTHTFRAIQTNTIFENKDIYVEETSNTYMQPTSSQRALIKPGFIKINEQSNSIEIGLKNQKKLILASVNHNEVEEGTSHCKFIQYYPKVNYVLFLKEYWEDEEYLLISLKDGTITKLQSRPVFSKNQEKFCLIEKTQTSGSKLLLYTIKNEKISSPFVIDINTITSSWKKDKSIQFFIEDIAWIETLGIRCFQAINNKDDVIIWIKRTF